MQALRGWVSDQRIDFASEQRASSRWQQQLLSEELSLLSVLEQTIASDTVLSITTISGTQRGIIGATGADFCALSQQGRTTLIAVRAISSIQLDVPWRSVMSSPVEPTPRPTLADALSLAVEDRLRARVITLGTAEVRAGNLVAVGNDVLVLDQSGPPPYTTLIPIDQLAEVSF